MAGLADIRPTRIRTIIMQHKYIDKIHKDKQVDWEMMEKMAAKYGQELKDLHKWSDKLLMELRNVSPTSSDADTVKHYLDQIEQTVSSQTTATSATTTTTTQVVLTPLLDYEPSSVIAMIIEAIEKAKELEQDNELLSVMYSEASGIVDELTAKVNESKIKEQEMEQQIQNLTRSVGALEQQQQQQQQQQHYQQHAHLLEVDIISQHRRHIPWLAQSISQSPDSDDNTLDLTSVDPTLLREKIRELRERNTALMNCNEKWNAICKNLEKEIEDAKRTLEETINSQMTRAGDHRARQGETQSLADWTTLICQLIQSLEERIVDLERNLAMKESLNMDSVQMADRDAKLAMEVQLEEYRKEVEEKNLEIGREKSNMKSLQTQLDTLYKQLDNARKEKEEAQQENARLKDLLKKAIGDKALLDRHLNRTLPTLSEGATSKSSRTQDDRRTQVMPSSQVSKPVTRGILEEDEVE